MKRITISSFMYYSIERNKFIYNKNWNQIILINDYKINRAENCALIKIKNLFQLNQHFLFLNMVI